MTELVEALNGIANAIGDSNLPLWASIADIVAPIILTSVSIWLTIRIDRKNGELQKALSNRDTVNQTRQYILEIYDAYFEACNLAYQTHNDVLEAFISDNSWYNWGASVDHADLLMKKAYNQSRMMLDDEELLKELKKVQEALSQINNTVKQYVYTGIPSQVIQGAWNEMFLKYQIQPEDYKTVFSNGALGEEFKKHCRTSYTENIQQKMLDFTHLVNTSSIPEKLREYIRIEPMK